MAIDLSRFNPFSPKHQPEEKSNSPAHAPVAPPDQLAEEPTTTKNVPPSSPPLPPTRSTVPPQAEAKREETVRVKFACRVDGLLESDKEALSLCSEIVKDVFPNGKTKEAYRYVRDFDSEPRFQNVQFESVASEGFEQLGLNVSKGLPKGEFKIEGVPKRAFEGTIIVSVTLDYSTALFVDNQRVRKDATLRDYVGKSQFIINPDPWDLWKEEEPNAALPYRKAHGDSFSCVLPTDTALVLIAASQRGRSHAQEGKFRDDHFFVDEAKSPEDWTIVAVADGAGSAQYSRQGSKIACETAVKTLRQLLAGKVENGDVDLFNAHLAKEWEKRFAEANAPKDETQASKEATTEKASGEAGNSDESIVLSSESATDVLPDAEGTIILDENVIQSIKGSEESTIDTQLNDVFYEDQPNVAATSKDDETFLTNCGYASETVQPQKEESNETTSAADNAPPSDAPNASEASSSPEETQTSPEEDPISDAQEAPASTSKRDALEKALFDCLHTVVYKAYMAINDEANAISQEYGKLAKINSFNTTLLLTALKRLPATESAPAAWVLLSYWVGDGALAVCNPDGKETILTLGTPDGGEFAGQTRFLTMRDEIDAAKIAARSRLVFLQDFDKIALMTDGVSDPFFPAEKDFQSYARWKEFWIADMPEHMKGVIDSNASLEEREKALLDGLMFKVPGNHDDRTLLLILNEEGGKAGEVSSGEAREDVELETSEPTAEIQSEEAKNQEGDAKSEAREEGREG